MAWRQRESGSACIFLSKSNQVWEEEPSPVCICTGVLVLRLTLNRGRHTFKMKHWVCIMQLLLLWIQTVYPGNTWVTRHLGNEFLHLLHTIQRVRLESKIYFYSTFSESWLIWSEPERNFKYLFPPGTAGYRQAWSDIHLVKVKKLPTSVWNLPLHTAGKVQGKCWTSPENPTQSRWLIFFFPCRSSRGLQKHCATELLTATVLQTVLAAAGWLNASFSSPSAGPSFFFHCCDILKWL